VTFKGPFDGELTIEVEPESHIVRFTFETRGVAFIAEMTEGNARRFIERAKAALGKKSDEL
jgi:hypothetical protein